LVLKTQLGIGILSILFGGFYFLLFIGGVVNKEYEIEVISVGELIEMSIAITINSKVVDIVNTYR
jgi:hypothetical protein